MTPCRRFAWTLPLLCAAASCFAQAGFSVEMALQAPYALSLSAAHRQVRFAWVEVQEGRHNLWAATPSEPAHALTHYGADDGLELRELAWLPGDQRIAYTRGPESGADGTPANPAHLQPPPHGEIWLAGTERAQVEPTLVGDGHAPLPTPDGKHLLLVRSGQVWIADLDAVGATSASQRARPAVSAGSPADRTPAATRHGLPVRQLVFDRGSASQMTLSPDGGTLAFVSRRDHNHSFVALFDLRRRVLSFPAPSTGSDSAPVFSPDGRQLAWLRAPWTEAAEFAANTTSPNSWSLQVLDLASGQVRTAFAPAANRPGSVLPHLSTGDSRVWWTADGRLLFASEADGWVHLYALDPRKPGSAPMLLTPGNFEVEDVTVSADGRQLALAANATAGAGTDAADGDRRHLWWLDLSAANARPVLLTPGEGLETHPVFSGDGSRIAALQAGVHTPNQPVVLDPHAPSSKPALLASPRRDPEAGKQFVTPQPVLFASADKLFTLHGQLFTPPFSQSAAPGTPAGTSVKRPVLLFFHGGPRRQMLLGYPAMEYYMRAYALNQYFASRGFIVLSVNYRRGIGYGLDFREAANTGADGAAEYNDVLGAVAYLRSRPDVDPARVGLWGGSYGGYLTALGLARNSDLFAAGVDYHGVHDWILEDNRADWLRGTAAEQAAIATRAHESSPLADVDKWKSPVLLIHGDNDANVVYNQTPVLADALRARGVPVEELIFPDEIHEFLLHRDWLAAYQKTAEFLERILQPSLPQPQPHPPQPRP